MDVAAIATTLLGAQTGVQQADMAMSMLRMSKDASAAMADMLANAVQGGNSLANQAPGVGANLNISA